MAHLIDKSALVAEIERICAEEKALFDEYCRMGFEPSPSPAVVCMKMECLLSFINTLEVKEVEEPNASDRGTAEEIIINLKRVGHDYRINLTKEIEWVRNQAKKGK